MDRHLVRSYGSSDSTTRVWAALVLLAVCHLLGLASFFSIPFAMETPKNLLMELLEVEFWVFPAVFVSIWGLISLLVIFHYEVLCRPGEMRSPWLLWLGVCGVLLAIAIGAMRFAPSALPLFQAFGADLPEPTLFVLNAGWVFLLLPAAAALLMAGAAFVPYSRAVRLSSGGMIFLLTIGNASLFGALGSLYLPFFKTCGSPEMVSGFTPLHAAAALGREASVRRHLAQGADVNAQDVRGSTPLDAAVDNRRHEVAQLLVARGGFRSREKAKRLASERPKDQASVAPSFGSCSA